MQMSSVNVKLTVDRRIKLFGTGSCMKVSYYGCCEITLPPDPALRGPRRWGLRIS